MNQQTQKRGLMPPLLYLVLGLVGGVIGLFLIQDTGGFRGPGLLGFVLLTTGAVFVVTGVIRGATRGWLTRNLD